LGQASLAVLAAALAGCGFELRRTPPLPFKRIALLGFSARSPLADELRERLRHSAQLVEAPAQADVVLHAVADRRLKSVVASTAAGQVRELTLRVEFHFRLSTPGGRTLIPVTELLLSRDMSTSETIALAKAQEEAEIYAAMQSDVVQQVLRRLARVDLQATPGTAPAGAPRG
jgi:LPS-assembly lipoprotein